MSFVFKLVSFGGLAILAVLVVVAILALSGHYEHSFTNPPS